MIIYICCSFSGFYRRIRGKRGEEWKKWGDDRGVKEREESGDGKRKGGRKREEMGRERREGRERRKEERGGNSERKKKKVILWLFQHPLRGLLSEGLTP